jgi:glutamate decarboxylase
MRVVVREDFSKSRCDALICDIKLALNALDAMDKKRMEEHQQHVIQNVAGAWKTNVRRRMSSIYSDETHSLQGQTGKTHAPC